MVMRKFRLWVTILTLGIYFGCGALNYGTAETGNQPIGTSGEIKILQSWQGDYPVAQLILLQEKQREQAVGYIDDAETFEEVWKAFKPGEDVPEIDFNTSLVIFARNTQFYNLITLNRHFF